ncbi:hypoxanthine phosphoribosyltransferase [Bdellovibrionota bacterium FG-2]
MFNLNEFKLYLGRHEIEQTVKELAHRLNQDYEGKEVLLIVVLKGALIFAADLVRQISFTHKVEFVRLSSYGRHRTSSGTITVLKDIEIDVRGKHLLIVEEIIDTGRTLKFLYERLNAGGAASVEIITLLDKKIKRLVEVPAKYVGREVSDEFLIGYGLDLEEKCRDLPDIYCLKFPH